MSKSFQLIPVALMSLLFSNCKKDNSNKINLISTIIVVNAAVDIPSVKVNLTGNKIIYATAPSVTYGAGTLYYAPRAATSFSIVSSADTNTFLINKTFNLSSEIYTLYLVGQAPNIDTLFRQETNFPFIPQNKIYTSSDSVVNVRFVNLSPNSNPVKIKIVNASANEVDNLPYKSSTNFRAYDAKLTTTAYAFQIRDAATDALLVNYTFNATATNRFKNVALVIKGLAGITTGTNAFSVAAVNYF
jgi:hypothetical protein